VLVGCWWVLVAPTHVCAYAAHGRGRVKAMGRNNPRRSRRYFFTPTTRLLAPNAVEDFESRLTKIVVHRVSGESRETERPASQCRSSVVEITIGGLTTRDDSEDVLRKVLSSCDMAGRAYACAIPRTEWTHERTEQSQLRLYLVSSARRSVGTDNVWSSTTTPSFVCEGIPGPPSEPFVTVLTLTQGPFAPFEFRLGGNGERSTHMRPHGGLITLSCGNPAAPLFSL
jgi:hypothetical protein